MSPLLAPILAQVITLQVGDRTEARYIEYGTSAYEGETSPSVQLGIGWGRADFAVGYGPSLTLTPLERKPRDLLVFHEAAASAGYSWRKTRLQLTSSVGVGDVNFRVDALQGPGGIDLDADGEPAPDDTPDDATGGGQDPQQPQQPTTGGTDAPQPGQQGEAPPSGELRIVDRVVRYYRSTTTLSLTHEPVRNVSLGAEVGYTRAGGLNEAAELYYPVLSGWFVGGNVAYRYSLDSRNAFVSNASLVKTWSSNENQAATLNATETLEHIFDRRTQGSIGAGLNITRFSQPDGLRGFSVFPTFQASLSHQISLFRGLLSTGIYTYASPALDPLRALVDPRLGGGGYVSYTRRRFSMSLNGGAQLSLAPVDHDAGSIDSAQADARVAYRIAELVEVDAGGRYARQAVQGVTVLPPSWAAFVGLNAGYLFQLSGTRH